MQNEKPEDSVSVRDVMDRYSPIVGGRTGLIGAFLKVVHRAVEAIPKLNFTPSPVPTPQVLFTSRNLAGQSITTDNVLLATTFKRMEQTLQKSFKKASGEDASLGDRERFVELARQIQEDAAILAAKCFITKPQGEAKYQFVLEPQPGQHIPLTKAFTAVQQQYKSGCDNEVELIRFGTDRPVILMRPVKGFKKASRKSPVA